MRARKWSWNISKVTDIKNWRSRYWYDFTLIFVSFFNRVFPRNLIAGPPYWVNCNGWMRRENLGHVSVPDEVNCHVQPSPIVFVLSKIWNVWFQLMNITSLKWKIHQVLKLIGMPGFLKMPKSIEFRDQHMAATVMRLRESGRRLFGNTSDLVLIFYF